MGIGEGDKWLGSEMKAWVIGLQHLIGKVVKFVGGAEANTDGGAEIKLTGGTVAGTMDGVNATSIGCNATPKFE